MEAPPSTPPAGARTDSPPTAGPLSRSRRRPPISLETPVEELVLADRPVWLLLSIAVVAIAVLLVLIIKVRLHAFFSLIVVAVATGLAAGIGVGDVIDVVIDGFSDTVGTVALLVGFGAVLGRLIEVTGGAQVLADKMLDTFGERRAPLALAVASLFYAFPIFLDAGFIVMLPVIYTVARRLGGRSEEHTSELQSRGQLVCRLLLENKNQ